MHFGGCCPLTEFCQVQNSVCGQVLHSPILQRYCTALEQRASAKLCGAQQRAPPILGRTAITLGIGPHFSWSKDVVNWVWLSQVVDNIERLQHLTVAVADCHENYAEDHFNCYMDLELITFHVRHRFVCLFVCLLIRTLTGHKFLLLSVPAFTFVRLSISIQVCRWEGSKVTLPCTRWEFIVCFEAFTCSIAGSWWWFATEV